MNTDWDARWAEVLSLKDEPVRCGDAFVQLSRDLCSRSDGKELENVGACLRDATRLGKDHMALRRHFLVCAAREAIHAGNSKHNLVREFGCDDYMTAPGDDRLMDPPMPGSYRFAEFLCYALALLRGKNATIEVTPDEKTSLHPGLHGMSTDQVLDVFGTLKMGGNLVTDVPALLLRIPELRDWWKFACEDTPSIAG